MPDLKRPHRTRAPRRGSAPISPLRRSLMIAFGASAVTFFSAKVTPREAVAKGPTPKTIENGNGLTKLLAEFAKSPGVSAKFDDEKKIALLKAPLRSSGQVYFHPPHSLARVVTKPRKSHLVIKADRIIVKENGVRKEVDLSDKPTLRALVKSLLQVLAGDRQALLENYEATFEGQADAEWKLLLTPKNANLKNMVHSFSFKGTRIILSELTVSEASGDSTTTKFSAVNVARKFTSEEIARFFDI